MNKRDYTTEEHRVSQRIFYLLSTYNKNLKLCGTLWCTDSETIYKNTHEIL